MSTKVEGLRHFDIAEPTEFNAYRLFDHELEDDPQVLFHATPARNFDSIIKMGFQSAKTLGTGELASVSYAIHSDICLTHIGRRPNEPWAIFIVRFENFDSPRVRVNQSDIHVFDEELKPQILGFGIVPAGMHWR